MSPIAKIRSGGRAQTSKRPARFTKVVNRLSLMVIACQIIQTAQAMLIDFDIPEGETVLKRLVIDLENLRSDPATPHADVCGKLAYVMKL